MVEQIKEFERIFTCKFKQLVLQQVKKQHSSTIKQLTFANEVYQPQYQMAQCVDFNHGSNQTCFVKRSLFNQMNQNIFYPNVTPFQSKKLHSSSYQFFNANHVSTQHQTIQKSNSKQKVRLSLTLNKKPSLTLFYQHDIQLSNSNNVAKALFAEKCNYSKEKVKLLLRQTKIIQDKKRISSNKLLNFASLPQ